MIPPEHSDCTVVGASFGGLACANALAHAGLAVTVLEKRADVGEKLHTTGILVREAVDEIQLLEGLPPGLVRRVDGVRLYAPNLRSVDLDAPGYYFLATDTPGVMRWLAAKAQAAVATPNACPTAFGCMAIWGQRVFSSVPMGRTRRSRGHSSSAQARSFSQASSTSTRTLRSTPRTDCTASSIAG
jgi:phytoene dehydrogenase-like protein